MELWTPQHLKTLLPAIAAMLVISALLRRILGGKSLNTRLLPVKIIAIMLILLEMGKQVSSFRDGYDLYHIPLHYCSLFLFTLPVMAFYNGKHRQTVYGVTAGVCGALFLLMLIYPNLIYSGANIQAFFTDFFSLHTVAFHNLVMLAFLLIIALRLHTPQKRGEQKAVVLFTVGFCVVSATMAQILKTNYANFYTCNIPPLEDLRLAVQGAIGYWPTQLLYITIVSLLTVLFTVMSYWVYRLLLRVTAPKAQQKASL